MSGAGPWGPRDGQPEIAAAGGSRPFGSSGRSGSLAPGSSVLAGPLGNVVSTLLLAAVLYWLWRDALLVAAALVGVFVHEFGHVIAMNLLGCGPARIRIVPFFGGAAIPARPPATAFRDVLISLSGPVFGLLAAVPFVIAFQQTGETRWLRGAVVIGAINLMNLLPAPPLDGARALGPVLARVHPALERAVMALIGVAAVLWLASRGDWFVALFIGLGVFSAVRRGVSGRPPVPLTWPEWLLSILGWLCALGLCAVTIGLALEQLGVTISVDGLLRVLGLRQ